MTAPRCAQSSTPPPPPPHTTTHTPHTPHTPHQHTTPTHPKHKHHKTTPPPPLPSSGDRKDIRSRLAGLGHARYNPVNVLWVDGNRALVAHVDDSGPVRVVELAPGPHVLTTRDVDDSRSAKVAMLRAGMDRVLAAGADPRVTIAGLKAMLADNTSATDSPVDAACIHGDVYGTVSASTVIAGGGQVVYEHAPGRPCVTPFEDVAIAG